MMRKVLTFAILGMLTGVMFWAASSSQDVIAGQSDGYAKKGRELFRKNCAVCHGLDAKGNGPAATELKKQPADLTVIQKRGQEFPIYKVLTFIDGERVVPAHGTREMPIWGTIFRRTEGEMLGTSDTHALAKYIQSLQKFGQ